MTTPVLIVGLVLLAIAVSGLGFVETVLAQMGVNRLRKLLVGDKGDEEFTPEEQGRLLTTLYVIRLFGVMSYGALVLAAGVDVGGGPWIEAAVIAGLGLVVALCDTLARRHARYRAQAVAGGVLVFSRRLVVLLSPVVSIIYALTSPFAPTRAAEPLASLEDLSEEILDLRAQGLLKDTQTELFQSLLDFGETIAREVMVPRVDMICTQLGTPIRDVLQLMHEHGYSRIPAYNDTIDEIMGFVHVKDLIVDLGDAQRPLSQSDLREVLVVPGTRKVGEILRDLQSGNRALAIVLDEYGGTDGVLTVEDIVEEIVGEINDEYDTEVAEIENIQDGVDLVDAKMVLEDVNEKLNMELPVDSAETLGGYLYELLGHVPTIGEFVRVEDVLFAVEQVQRNRITWIKVDRTGKITENELAERDQVA